MDTIWSLLMAENAFWRKITSRRIPAEMRQMCRRLANVGANHDDILIYGTGDTVQKAIEYDDATFKARLERYRDPGLKLNKKKLKFKLDKVAYRGHVLCADGISADPENAQAICNMPHATDIQGVPRLLGVVTYLAKCLPQLSTIVEPLQHLTDKGSVFDWLPQHQEAFSSIKTPNPSSHSTLLQCQQRGFHRK